MSLQIPFEKGILSSVKQEMTNLLEENKGTENWTDDARILLTNLIISRQNVNKKSKDMGCWRCQFFSGLHGPSDQELRIRTET